MAKFCVQIFGKVPDEIEIEADSAQEAEEKAITQVLEELDFEVEPIEPEPAKSIGETL